MGLTKKEEKLLRRMFQKRRNELESFISNNMKTLEKLAKKDSFIESVQVTMARHRKEIDDLARLEAKVFKEIYKHENSDDSRQTIRQDD